MRPSHALVAGILGFVNTMPQKVLRVGPAPSWWSGATSNSRIWLVIGVVGLNLLVALLVASDLWNSYRAAQERVGAATRNLAQLLERDITANLDKVSVALGSLVNQFDRQLAGKGIDHATIRRVIDAESALVPEAEMMGLFDATGVQICDSGTSCPHLSIADRDYFRQLRERGGDAPILSAPLESRYDRQWGVVLARPMRHPDGSFAGAAIALMALGHFKSEFAALELGSFGAVSLRTSNLSLLVRHPGPLRMPGEAENRKVSEQLEAAVAAHPNEGTYLAPSAIDGIERSNAYRRFTRYPLYIIVGLGTADYLDEWRGDVLMSCGISLTFLLASVTLVLWARANWRRNELGEARVRSLLESVAEGIVFHASDGSIVEANTAAERILGLSADQIMGRAPKDPRWQALTPEGSPMPGEQHPAAITLRTGEPLRQQLMGIQDPTRGLRWISVNTQIIPTRRNDCGPAVAASFADVTERVQTEARLLEREALFRGLFEQSVFLAGVLDEDGRVLELNERALAMLGVRLEQALGQPFRSMPCWYESPDLAQLDQVLTAARAGIPGSFETSHPVHGGGRIDVVFNAMPERLDGGMRIAVVGVDISERRAVEERLRVMNKDFVALLELTTDFIYFKDGDSRFRFCSQTLARITGHGSWRDMIGKHVRDVFPAEMAWIYETEEAQVYREGVPLLNQVDRFLDERGEPGWVSTNKWPVFDDQGSAVVGLFGIGRVVTEQKRLEDELRKLAVTDSLTGVANRREFIRTTDHELARQRRDPTQCCSLLMFDLDNFKSINDTHGHACGDAVLKHVTQLASRAARQVDLVGRLGGEEFGVLLPGSIGSEALAFAERLRGMIESSPFCADQLVVAVTVSVGVTDLLLSDSLPEHVIARADKAMYAAKHLGRNRVIGDLGR